MLQTTLSSVRLAVWTPRVAAVVALGLIASGALCEPAVMVISSTPTNAKVFVNGGQRGLQVRLSPTDAQSILKALAVPLITD